MAWGRLDDQANSNAKLLALSDAGWRMWGCAIIYCQANLTDGFIPEHAIQTFGVRARNKRAVADELCAVLVPGKGPLWHKVDGGYQVHDYFDWNDSREQVLTARLTAKQRMALFQNPGLRQLIRQRDGDECQYCGVTVRWNDRKGPHGGTYDHVDPYGGNETENLVVSCRGCNSSKRGRTPEQAGMTLKRHPNQIQIASKSESKSESALQQASTTTTTVQRKERAVAPPEKPAAPTRALLTLFDACHQQKLGTRAQFSREKDAALIARLWRDRRGDTVDVETLIREFFALEDDWVREQGYSVGVFVSQVPKILARLAAKHGQNPAPTRGTHVPDAEATKRLLA